ELLGAIRLDERAELVVVALVADLGVDLVAHPPPPVDGAVDPLAVLDRPDGAVEGDPGHDLRVDEVSALAADLPDPLVGHAPRLLEVLEERELDPPRVRVELEPVHARLIEAVEHLAVDVELELFARRVADAHR